MVSHCQNPPLDFVGDVGNNLHSATIVATSPLIADNLVVHLTSGNGIQLGQSYICKAGIGSQVQVRLRTIFGNKYLTVLIGTHISCIYIDIGIAFHHGHRETTALQKASYRRSRHSLAKAGTNTASYNNVLTHASNFPAITLFCQCQTLHFHFLVIE